MSSSTVPASSTTSPSRGAPHPPAAAPADLWDDAAAPPADDLLASRIHSSRLLGRDASLVMHGGGNTSVKATVATLLGEQQEVLYVKGSGWDLATIEAAGFPAVDLAYLRRLRRLESLSDPRMVNELRTHLVDAKSPDPSVEALLHAFIPARFVDHTHADAVLTLTNQSDGERLIRQLYGRRVGIVPYVMPGFRLAKLCAEVYERDPSVEGLILLKHGVFTFGDTAKQAYQRMIAIVRQAEELVASRRAARAEPAAEADEAHATWWNQELRAQLLRRGFRGVCLLDASPAARRFVDDPRVAEFSQRGPLTPDHVLRTKRLPLLIGADEAAGRDGAALSRALDGYADAYRAYFERCAQRTPEKLVMLDPWPRIALIPGVGIVAVGASAKDARIALDIYQHTAAVILDAEAMGGYQALPEADIFDVEYWVLEQAKLKLGPKRAPLTGKTALVSGAASGIGLAIAREFAAQGANVVVMDQKEDAFAEVRAQLAAKCGAGNQVRCESVDVTSRASVGAAIARAVRAWGGIDIVVVNAGIFPPSAAIERIGEEQWHRAMSVNLDGAFHLIAEALPWLKRQSAGGDVVLVGTKNVCAPGKDAAAYSVSKAAQAQLARVCALEAGAHGVRVNLLHPHLVFDTALWTPEVLEARAKAYGMSVEQYKTNNLLKAEITTADVARAAFALVGGFFDKTTGAQIAVDGGSDRTI
jgi:rhamnulose-1-phosphate aldolase/alcohol dehydrogenase